MTSIFNFVISILFIFTVLSLLTSWFIEFYARQINKRGRFMWSKLKRLIQKLDTRDSQQDLINKVLANPIVKSLSKDDRPEFLPPELFAKALATEVVDEKHYQNLDYEAVKKVADRMNVTDDFKALWSDMISELEVEGGKTIKALEAKIVQWFSFYEDRLKTWYKDHIRLYLMGAGIILAGAANIDSIAITKTLWLDKNLSEVVALQAEDYSDNSIDTLQQIIDKHTLAYLKNLGIPLGWKSAELKQAPFMAYVWKVVGIILTGFAISFGAPFWFDLLKNVVGWKRQLAPPATQPNAP